MNLNERILVWLLRFAGTVMLMATGAVFMPFEWMAAAHSSLGLGEIPRAPVFEYLARTTSGLYAIHGGLFLLAASNLRRYRGLAFYICWAGIAFGFVVLWIDFQAGMPYWWTLMEVGQVVPFNILCLILLRKVGPAPG